MLAAAASPRVTTLCTVKPLQGEHITANYRAPPSSRNLNKRGQHCVTRRQTIHADAHRPRPQIHLRPRHGQANTVVDFLRDLFNMFGCAQELITDRGTNFMAEQVESFLRASRVAHVPPSSYHSQSNKALQWNLNRGPDKVCTHAAHSLNGSRRVIHRHHTLR